jgi:hypothetical protein
LIRGESFDNGRFEKLVAGSGIAWPRTDTGRLRQDKDTIKDISRVHGEPWISIRELKSSLAKSAVDGLRLGPDKRLYASPRPFMTITGRNAPSTSEFLWSGPKWTRSLLQPPEGRSLLYADWSNQEYAIAAALSEDPAMLKAYGSGDPYLALARMAGAVPGEATKASHPRQREAFKIVSLATLMGMGPESIGRRTGGGPIVGQQLLHLHKKVFSKFWSWSDAVGDTGAAARDIETAFGLVYNPGDPAHYKPRTARNFLLQSTGSDMLRVAVLLLADAGTEVIATIHDAVLVECDTTDAEDVEAVVKSCMEEASRITLWDRLTVRVDSDRVGYPFHYQDEKGIAFWRKLAPLLGLPLDDNELPDGHEG